MNTIKKIQLLDAQFKRPATIKIDNIAARILYAQTPDKLLMQYDPVREQIATIKEVMQLRIGAVKKLTDNVPELGSLLNQIYAGEKVSAYSPPDDNRYRVLAKMHQYIDTNFEQFAIWRIRPTTATHMIRVMDHERDTICFYHGNPFETEEEYRQAFSEKLSDGGIPYSTYAINNIVTNTPAASKISYETYIRAKGGNFTGIEWLNHPIFSTACGDKDIMEDYVLALQILNLMDFYNQGKHSGWRPGEMKQGFGRPIALGYKGETFYPPNNSTVDHAMIVLPQQHAE